MDDPSTAAALDEALRAVERESPYWHCWAGILPHLLYARRPLSSPPKVVRAATPAALAAEIHHAETGCTPVTPCTEHDPGSGS